MNRILSLGPEEMVCVQACEWKAGKAGLLRFLSREEGVSWDSCGDKAEVRKGTSGPRHTPLSSRKCQLNDAPFGFFLVDTKPHFEASLSTHKKSQGPGRLRMGHRLQVGYL